MTQSFSKQSVDDVALTLARRKVALRHGLSKPMTKSAFDWENASKNIGKWWGKQNPLTQNTMIGAGVGGTLGLGSSLFRRDKKRPFRDTLTGALAGGAMGAGYSALKDPKGTTDLIMGEISESQKDKNKLLADQVKKREWLEQGATTSWFNNPLAKAHSTLTGMLGTDEKKPEESGLHKLLRGAEYGIAGEVIPGSLAAAAGLNYESPGVWRQISQEVAEQMNAGAGKPALKAADTPIGKAITSVEGGDHFLNQLMDPKQIKNVTKPQAVMVPGGVKEIHPKEVLKVLRHQGQLGTYRPMGTSDLVRRLFGKAPATMQPSWTRTLGRVVPRGGTSTVLNPMSWRPFRKSPKTALVGGGVAAVLYALLRTGAITQHDYKQMLKTHDANQAANNSQSQ